MIYGYLRRALVDSDDQFAEQNRIVTDLISEHMYNIYGKSDIPSENIVVEEIAISAQSYPQLEKLLDRLERGDELVIYSPDRVAGTARTFHDRCAVAAKKGAYITVARPPVFVNNFEQPLVKPTSFKADSNEMFVLEMVASIDSQVQNERTNTLNKKMGRKGGRPPALSDEKLARMKEMFKAGSTQQEISKEFDISQATVSRYYNEIILGKGRAPSSPYKQDPTVVREKRKIYERKRRQRLKEAAEAGQS